MKVERTSPVWSTYWVRNRSAGSSGPEKRIGPPWNAAEAKFTPGVELLLSQLGSLHPDAVVEVNHAALEAAFVD